jgi:hypothetical protein
VTAPACCPNCGFRINGDAGAIEAKTAELRDWCDRSGRWPTADGRVTEKTAAEILGRAPGTLRNWRSGDRPLRFNTAGGRVTYALRDLAEFIVKSASD